MFASSMNKSILCQELFGGRFLEKNDAFAREYLHREQEIAKPVKELMIL